MIVIKNLAFGAIAGAVGTMALDVVSYGDMAIRGRAASDLPADVVDKLAVRVGVGALAKSNDDMHPNAKNRRSAVGALMGYGVGVSIGAMYGLTRQHLRWIPWPIAGAVLGAVAMAASDVPATKLQATDPSTWPASAWVSDIVPHLAYGMVVALTYESIA